jgi:hypothetical protein
LVSIVVPVATAVARSQTEVDRAADEVARVAAERAEAQRVVDAWAARGGTVQDELVAALFALHQTNAQQEETSFELFGIRDEIFAAEARLRHLRSVTESRAVEVYMNGAVSSLFSVWSASNFEQSALLEETTASALRIDALELANLAAARDQMADLQEGYRQTQERLRALREESENQSRQLQELFSVVDDSYVESYRGLRRADAGYQQAVTEFEAAQRRRAARAGVEPWRPLVEQYFPEELVEDALNVMRCESGGNPDAVHPESDATGLYQFLGGTWVFSSANAGFPGASRFDAEANVSAAAWLVEYSVRTGHPRGAWGHWVCKP